MRIARSGLSGVAGDSLARELELSESTLAEVLGRLAEAGRAIESAAARWLDAGALASLEARILAALDAFHAAEALRPGMPRGALRGRLPENAPADAVALAVDRLEATGRLAVDGDLVRRVEHRPELDSADREVAERLLAEARDGGLEPPTPREWAERVGLAPERLRELLAHLEREGALVRAPGDIWFDPGAVAGLRERVVAHLREHGSLDTPTYKALIGTTRRYAVPLMELFDGERLTLRAGEARVLRGKDSR